MWVGLGLIIFGAALLAYAFLALAYANLQERRERNRQREIEEWFTDEFWDIATELELDGKFWRVVHGADSSSA